MNELLKKYAHPCLTEKIKKIQELPNYKTIFKNFKSDEDVRKYFFTTHNKIAIKEKKQIHTAIPYKITKLSKTRIKTQIAIKTLTKIPFSLYQQDFSLEIFPNAKLEDIIITHFTKPVDYISKEEFNNYKDFFIL